MGRECTLSTSPRCENAVSRSPAGEVFFVACNMANLACLLGVLRIRNRSEFDQPWIRPRSGLTRAGRQAASPHSARDERLSPRQPQRVGMGDRPVSTQRRQAERHQERPQPRGRRRVHLATRRAGRAGECGGGEDRKGAAGGVCVNIYAGGVAEISRAVSAAPPPVAMHRHGSSHNTSASPTAEPRPPENPSPRSLHKSAGRCFRPWDFRPVDTSARPTA